MTLSDTKDPVKARHQMTTNASRTARDVFRDHAQAMASGDLARIVGDYADDAIFITHAGVLHGKDGVRDAFVKIFEDLPDARWDVHTRILEGDVLFLEWTAHAAGSRTADGVETFVARDGAIVVQTAHYRMCDA
jgi:ketosteroid isomerase-like protein